MPRKSRKKKSSRAAAQVRIVDLDDEGVPFYEAESVVAKRVHHGEIQYRVRWKGFPPEADTWEPDMNLCDSLYLQARMLELRENERKLELNAEAADDDADADDGNPNDHYVSESSDGKPAAKKQKTSEPDEEVEVVNGPVPPRPARDLFSRNMALNFREIERIDVNSEDVRQRVSDARLSGTPIVITGHRGWAQFAAPWLKLVDGKPAASNDTPKDESDQHKGDSRDTGVADSLPNGWNGASDASSLGTSDGLPREDYAAAEATAAADALASLAAGEPASNALPCGEIAVPDRLSDIEALGVGGESVDPCASSKEEGSDSDADGIEAQVEPDGLRVNHAETSDELLDLSLPYELDGDKMSADIGDESVRILGRNYDPLNPKFKDISLSAFLQNCWSQSVAQDRKKSYYLHQWQFPLSETAREKLCGPGRNHSLPFLGEDLLKYWLDDVNDSSYQYLFMGDTDSLTKIHKDKGGLMITIAPIVGEKEVVLVHRSDGSSCLYHLSASIDSPDTNTYPLMAFARVWKSVIKPGEILIMPQGTYHQCRNLSPCLSYSRFFLDTVNLKAFYDSYVDQDASEIDHFEILWNASHSLHSRLGEFTDSFRKDGSAVMSEKKVEDTVNTLKSLRLVARALSQHDEKKYGWEEMVNDIDMSLHHFHYRDVSPMPPFRPMRKNKKSKPMIPLRAPRCDEEFDSSDDESNDSSRLETHLQKAIRRCPKLKAEQEGLVVADTCSLHVDDEVLLRVHGRCVPGFIREIHGYMTCAYLKYLELPECHDSFQPVASLRLPSSDSRVALIDAELLRPGTIVLHCDDGEDYRAKVKRWRKATFYLVELKLDRKCPHETKLWIMRDSILSSHAAGCDESDDELTAEGNRSVEQMSQSTLIEEVEEAKGNTARSDNMHDDSL